MSTATARLIRSRGLAAGFARLTPVAGARGRWRFWYRANAPSMSSAVFSTASTGSNTRGQLSEFSGVATSSPLDQTGIANTTSASTSLAVTTSGSRLAAPGEVAVTAYNTTSGLSSFTAPSGWNSLTSDTSAGFDSDYRLSPASGSTRTGDRDEQSFLELGSGDRDVQAAVLGRNAVDDGPLVDGIHGGDARRNEQDDDGFCRSRSRRRAGKRGGVGTSPAPRRPSPPAPAICRRPRRPRRARRRRPAQGTARCPRTRSAIRSPCPPDRHRPLRSSSTTRGQRRGRGPRTPP